MTSKYGTTDEVAEYLHISPKTLTNWRYTGKGPRSVRVGGCVRYLWTDVEQWINDQQADRKAG